MSQTTLIPPVILLISNHPEETEPLFQRVAEVRPSTLLVVADGPRDDHLDEVERCAEARKITEAVDWPCVVYRNYANLSLGRMRRNANGLDWAFAQVQEAIILEDGGLPHASFFRFIAELLEKYRDDERIMMISGTNLQGGQGRTADSYYFSIYAKVWVWATWQRAWRHYDAKVRAFPLIRDGGWLTDVLGDRRLVAYWTEQLEQVYQGETDIWDYQWLFACWLQVGYCISPRENMISNIGYETEARRAKGRSALDGLEAGPCAFLCGIRRLSSAAPKPTAMLRRCRAGGYSAGPAICAARHRLMAAADGWDEVYK